jgi:hypothetical protein
LEVKNNNKTKCVQTMHAIIDELVLLRPLPSPPLRLGMRVCGGGLPFERLGTEGSADEAESEDEDEVVVIRG